MRPLIVALGRSDNHALLASHARHLGVDYFGIEGHEVSETVRTSEISESWLSRIGIASPVYLAAIDSTVAASTLRSLIAFLHSKLRSSLLVRTDPDFLEALSATVLADHSANQSEINDSLYLLSVARSPHNQIAIWPIVELSRDGTITSALGVTESIDPILAEALDQAIAEVASLSLVGVCNYVIDTKSAIVTKREFGASTFTFWSESASYTSVSEQIIRAILDLPLGDCRMIDFEEYFLQEEIELDSVVMQDPIRPFLHLFARNPRLKVRYQGGDDANMKSATLSLFASSEEEALTEMAHARDFMLGS